MNKNLSELFTNIELPGGKKIFHTRGKTIKQSSKKVSPTRQSNQNTLIVS